MAIPLPVRIEYKWWDKYKPDDLPSTGVGEMIKLLEKTGRADGKAAAFFESMRGKSVAEKKAAMSVDLSALGDVKNYLDKQMQPTMRLIRALKELRDAIRGVDKYKDFSAGVKRLVELAEAQSDELRAALSAAMQFERTASSTRELAEWKLGSVKPAYFDTMKKRTQDVCAAIGQECDKMRALLEPEDDDPQPDLAALMARFKNAREQMDRYAAGLRATAASAKGLRAELEGAGDFDMARLEQRQEQLEQLMQPLNRRLKELAASIVALGNQQKSAKSTAKAFVRAAPEGKKMVDATGKPVKR